MLSAKPAGAEGIRINDTTGGIEYLKPGDRLTIGAGGANPEVRTVARVVPEVFQNQNPDPNVIFTQPLASAHAAGERVEGAALQTGVGFQPDYATEGKHEALEFAAGNYGLLESALEYHFDRRGPRVRMTAPYCSTDEIETTFEFVDEPATIRYTMDGSRPNSSSPLWDSTGPREPGQTFHIAEDTEFRWIATDIKGNRSTGSQEFDISRRCRDRDRGRWWDDHRDRDRGKGNGKGNGRHR
jgi:hypothetical protein